MISVNYIPIEEKFFPDGTFNLMHFPFEGRYINAERARHPVISWQYKDISEQVLLYNLAKHLRNLGASAPRLIMPYVPNARMDRVQDYDKEIPMLKFFADFINDLEFDKVLVLDPHSDTTMMLLNRARLIPREEFFKQAVKEFKPDVIVYPDAGAMKRYMRDGDFMYAEKVRDWETGKIEGVTIHNPLGLTVWKGMRVLISDDICSKGGTFYHVGNALKKMGIDHVGLYVSHCEDSIKDGKLFTEESPIEVVYTTDSIEREYKNDRLVVFPVMNKMV